jgi:hypothetical protein
MRLGAFMRPVSIHTAAWRYPGAFPDANFNFAHLKRFAQTLERGKFDAFFMADHLAVLNMPIDALKRSATVTSFDPATLLPALAVVTERLGLIATASTTFEAPYHVARRFASLDHLSGGPYLCQAIRMTQLLTAEFLMPTLISSKSPSRRIGWPVKFARCWRSAQDFDGLGRKVLLIRCPSRFPGRSREIEHCLLANLEKSDHGLLRSTN